MKLWKIVVAVVLIVLGIVVFRVDMARGDEIISRQRAQMISANLKNVGLCRGFVLGEAMVIRPKRAAGCHGVLYSIEGEDNGFFSVWVHHHQLYLEKLVPPEDFYKKSLAMVPAAEYSSLLYKDEGKKAVEVGKRFASAVLTEGSAPEYSKEGWMIVSSPNLVANRANLTLMSVDGMVRVQMSLVVLLRNGKCELEVCEVDVKRKPPSATPNPTVAPSAICGVEEVR